MSAMKIMLCFILLAMAHAHAHRRIQHQQKTFNLTTKDGYFVRVKVFHPDPAVRIRVDRQAPDYYDYEGTAEYDEDYFEEETTSPLHIVDDVLGLIGLGHGHDGVGYGGRRTPSRSPSRSHSRIRIRGRKPAKGLRKLAKSGVKGAGKIAKVGVRALGKLFGK